MRRTTLAEAVVSDAAQPSRQPLEGLRGAKNGCQETVFDGPLAIPVFGLTLGEPPVRTGVELLQLRYRRPVLRVEIGTPSRDPRPQFVGGRGRRPVGGVGGKVVGHGIS
ncbi:hypothetical protein GCM10009773_01000 [Williamsia serinedens]